jgi:hypothetical protein
MKSQISQRQTFLVTAAGLSALALGACSGDTAETNACGGKIVASDANNYTFSSTITLAPIKVKPTTDLTFDWGALTKDFVGHAVNVNVDINTIAMTMWKLTVSELQTKLNADSLEQTDLAVAPPTFSPDGQVTSAALTSFTLFGAALTPGMLMPFFDPNRYPPASHSYALMAATGSTPGVGTRMIQAFVLDPESTNTSVKVVDESATLTYAVDLRHLVPTEISQGTAAVALDWGDIKTNGRGSPFVATNITSAKVAHYVETPTELEARFLDLDLIATELYRAPVPAGHVLDFTSLKTDGGKAFTGIDNVGTWIFALQCGNCKNPAPWFLSTLKPCGQSRL